jgi:predicted TIM-barrel fold metal-dependent hydrolase
MAERIDAFAHVLPKPFLDEMMEVHPTEELDALSDAPRFWDMNIRFDDLDEYGINKQVITLARPPIWQGIGRGDAFEMIRLANNEVKKLANEHPDRLIPVATIPFLDGEFIDEFERCVDDLDMAGVQIFSNVDGKPIDAEPFLPFYDAVESKDVPIWLHPQLHEWHEWDSEYMLHKILGWPFDTSLALARLVFGGVMDRHPDLKLIPHHMGSMIPHFTNRLNMFHEMLVEHRDVYPYNVNELNGSVEETFSQFYGDTCRCGASDVLEDGLSFYGEDQFVFATDYPFGPNEGRGFLREEVQAVKNMDVHDETRKKVYGENLKSLLS